MNFKDMLDKLSMLSEATKETEKGRVHKADVGGYGRKYDTDEEGDEKAGDKDAAKSTEKRGRGRPTKAGSTADTDKKYSGAKELQSFIVGNVPKKPSKELKNLPSKKHSLKEFFEQIDEERMIKEAEQITMMPAKSNTQVIQQGNKTLGTVSNPTLAAQIKQAIGKGEMSLAGTELGEEKEKWIQKAVKHPGALRKKLGAKEGEPIPAGKLEKATHSKDPTTARQARLAQTLRKINKESINEGLAEGLEPELGGTPKKVNDLFHDSNLENYKALQAFVQDFGNQYEKFKQGIQQGYWTAEYQEGSLSMGDAPGYTVTVKNPMYYKTFLGLMSRLPSYERNRVHVTEGVGPKLGGTPKKVNDLFHDSKLENYKALQAFVQDFGNQVQKFNQGMQQGYWTAQQQKGDFVGGDAPGYTVTVKNPMYYKTFLGLMSKLPNYESNRVHVSENLDEARLGTPKSYDPKVFKNKGAKHLLDDPKLMSYNQLRIYEIPDSYSSLPALKKLEQEDGKKWAFKNFPGDAAMRDPYTFGVIVTKPQYYKEFLSLISSINPGLPVMVDTREKPQVGDGSYDPKGVELINYIKEVEQPTMDNMSAMGAGLGTGRSDKSLEEAKKTVKRDDKAEKAGRKVAKDIEYDEKVKDKIHGTKRHSEDEKAERAGKKVAKDIEYDEKKKHVKEATVKRDDKAEKAGKKVAKDIEYDEKVKDKIHGKKRHSEDEKAERAGKKVAKDIEYDEKKDKKKHVKEGMSHNISAARLEGKAHGLKGHAYRGKHYEDMEEARAYHEGYVEGLDECYGMEPIRGVVVGEEVPATVPGMANQAERMAMEADLDEMDKTEYMKHKARTTPGSTFKAFGQTMHDKDVFESPFAFESLDKQLNELLIEGEVVEEGMSVSISKGNQGAPDSVTVSAQDHEAEKLLSFIKQAGLGLFGDEQKSDYGSPAGEISKQSHGDIEVVDDHDGMMSLMKKMAGMEHGSDDGDYRDEEHHDDHDHEQEGPCNECGYMESDCQCDEEMVEDESYDQEEEIAAESDELAELKRLAGHNTAQPEIASREGMQEANPPDSGAKDTAIAVQDTKQANDNATDKEETFGSTMEDGSEASEQPVKPMTDEELDKAEKHKLDEWANNAGQKGTDTVFVTNDEFMIDTITSGLNKRKATGQATIPVIASQGARDGNEDIGAWKKLAGLTK